MRRILIFLSFLFYFLLCFTIFSEEAQINLVVTASRRESNILSSPAFTSVITSAEIAESGSSNLVELLSRQAGLNFSSYSNEAQAQVSLRGFGENSFGRVLVLVDGRRLNNPDMQGLNWLAIPLESIERIEILHGPGSVLYGNNAIGGVINIITKTPNKPWNLEVAASGGSFLTHNERVFASFRTRIFDLSVNGEYLSTQGHRDRSAYRSLNSQISLGVFPLEILQMKLDASYANLFYQMPGALSKEAAMENPFQAVNPADEVREEHFVSTLGTRIYAGETSYFQVDINAEGKTADIEFPSFANVDWGIPPSYIDRSLSRYSVMPKFALESSQDFWGLGLTIGLDGEFTALKVDTFGDQEKREEDLIGAYNLNQLTGGVYFNTEISLLSELFFLSGGLRYDTAKFDLFTAEEEDSDKVVHSALVYTAGITLRPLEGLKLFTRFGTQFRYPFTDEQFSVYGFSVSPNLSLGPERGYTLEAGGAYILPNKISFSLTGYLLVMEDEIAFNSSTFSNENLDSTQRLGLETEVSCKPLSFLGFRGSYTYVEPIFTEGPNLGKKVPLVPAHSGEGEILLDLPFGISLAPSFTVKSSCFSGGDYQNQLEEIPGHLLFNLSLSYSGELKAGILQIILKAENLMDTKYTPLVYWGGYYPAPGRQITLGLRFSSGSKPRS